MSNRATRRTVSGRVYHLATLALLSVAALALIVQSASANAHPQKKYKVRVTVPGQPAVGIHVVEQGAGPAIVLLHGLGASSYMWRRLMPRLARKHRVVAVDLRGFGWSDKPIDQHYGTDDHADVVGHLLQRMGIKEATLVGHSFGGAVALVIAARELESSDFKVSRLVLMDSPAFPQRASAGVTFLRTPLLSYVGLNLIPPQKLALLALTSVNGDRSFLSRQDLQAYAEPYRYHGARHALIQTGRQIEPRNFSAIVRAYSRMDQPALLVWCRQDRVVPLAIGVKLQKALPNAKLRIIDTCSHVPIEQAPEQTTRIIEDFLSEPN